MSLATDLNIVNKGLNDLFTSQGSDAHIGLGDLLVQIANSGSSVDLTAVSTDILPDADDTYKIGDGSDGGNRFSSVNVADWVLVGRDNGSDNGVYLFQNDGGTPNITLINAGDQGKMRYDGTFRFNKGIGANTISPEGGGVIQIGNDTQRIEVQNDGHVDLGQNPFNNSDSHRFKNAYLKGYLSVGDDDGQPTSNIIYVSAIQNVDPVIIIKKGSVQANLTFDGTHVNLDKPLQMTANIRTSGTLGLGNVVAAGGAPGTLAKKVEIFNENGVSQGFAYLSAT